MATKLFLLVDGINGGSKDVAHQGWFEIDGYDLDLTGLAAASSGGAGAGKAQFSPLMVDLALSSGLAEILAAVASGEHLAGIRLEGIKTGAEPVKVFDLALADVTVKTVHEENGTADHLAFDYTKIGVTPYTQKADGSPIRAQSFEFNVATNTIGDVPNAD